MLGYGAGLGTIAGLNTLVMIDVMGLERLAPLFGTTSLISAVTVLSLGTIIGEAKGSLLYNHCNQHRQHHQHMQPHLVLSPQVRSGTPQEATPSVSGLRLVC